MTKQRGNGARTEEEQCPSSIGGEDAGSSARGPAGRRCIAIRCWCCAVPHRTAHWLRCLPVINNDYGKRQNPRMLPHPDASRYSQVQRNLFLSLSVVFG